MGGGIRYWNKRVIRNIGRIVAVNVGPARKGMLLRMPVTSNARRLRLQANVRSQYRNLFRKEVVVQKIKSFSHIIPNNLTQNQTQPPPPTTTPIMPCSIDKDLPQTRPTTTTTIMPCSIDNDLPPPPAAVSNNKSEMVMPPSINKDLMLKELQLFLEQVALEKKMLELDLHFLRITSSSIKKVSSSSLSEKKKEVKHAMVESTVQNEDLNLTATSAAVESCVKLKREKDTGSTTSERKRLKKARVEYSVSGKEGLAQTEETVESHLKLKNAVVPDSPLPDTEVQKKRRVERSILGKGDRARVGRGILGKGDRSRVERGNPTVAAVEPKLKLDEDSKVTGSTSSERKRLKTARVKQGVSGEEEFAQTEEIVESCLKLKSAVVPDSPLSKRKGRKKAMVEQGIVGKGDRARVEQKEARVHRKEAHDPTETIDLTLSQKKVLKRARSEHGIVGKKEATFGTRLKLGNDLHRIPRAVAENDLIRQRSKTEQKLCKNASYVQECPKGSTVKHIHDNELKSKKKKERFKEKCETSTGKEKIYSLLLP